MSESKKVLLYVSHLKKYFPISSNLLKSGGSVRALDDVSFALREGETLGVVGETGCGKTTLGRTVLRLIDATAGDVYFNLPEDLMNKVIEKEGELDRLHEIENPSAEEIKEMETLEADLDEIRNENSLTRMSSRKMKDFRKFMQPIFQDPFSSLDPRKLVKDVIAEPMKLLTEMSSDEIFEKEKELIEEIGLSEDHLYRFPHEFSGGQRQRIGIARAIGIGPKLLVLDEPTSALDVSVQAQILNMLKEIQNELGLSYLFISHHLNVIRLMADRVAVMYLGRVAELTDTDRLFTEMLHPYTKALLSAIPSIDPGKRKGRIILEGEIPSPANPPKGCYFHPRCPEAMKNCGWSPRDIAGPIRSMLEPYRNPEAKDFPAITEIVTDEEANSLDIVLSAPVPNREPVLALFNELVEKEASSGAGIMFKSIESVKFLEDGTTIRVVQMEPDVPTLKEVRKGHFVSCLLYDKPIEETKEEVMENASTATSTD
jgi:oligopeptide/dipeptide ABC transporter ATP-binding protein